MNENGQEGGGWTPPYIAWRTLVNLFEKLETNKPPQIDPTFLAGSNQVRAQTMNTLKALELVQEDGTLTKAMLDIVEAGADRPERVGELLRRFYPKPVHLGTVNATQKQLDDAFGEWGVTGSTLRKSVSFYLKAAKYANLPLSPNFKTPSKTVTRKRRTNGGGGKKRNAASPPSGPGATKGPSLDALKTRYVDMLLKKAEEQDEMDEALLDRIESILDLGPASAGDGAADDGAEDED